MWMDVAQEVEQEPDVTKSDDEDTVYDRDNNFRRNPFAQDGIERKEMLEEGDSRCGIGSWRPQFLQEFVAKPTFTGVFIITGVLHGAAWSYFTACISTMEKRLKMSSETTGALLAVNELTQVIISIILSYFAIRTKRIKFVTLGASLWAVSCFVLVFIQFFFGSGKYALSLTKFNDNFDVDAGDSSDPSGDSVIARPLPYTHDRAMNVAQLCLRNVEFLNKTVEDCPIGESGSSFPISFVLVSQILAGTGTMFFLSSGGPYVEDVIMPNQLPVLFGITLSLRLIGPFLGYIFGSAFLKSFISTSSTPVISQYDPRWMGAYWLGFLIIGVFMAISAFALSLFPAQMPKEVMKKRSMTTDTGPPLLTLNSSAIPINGAELKIANTLPVAHNFMKTFLVFFNNDINLYITLSTIFHVFVAIGYWSFFPKYLELVFHEPAAQASVLTGTATVTFNAAGLLISGFVISNLLPSADRVSLWNALITILQVLILLLLTQFGCNNGDMAVGHNISDFNSFSTAFPNIPETLPPITESTTMTFFSSVSVDGSDPDFTSELTSLPTTTAASNNKRKTVVHLLSNCSVGCGCILGNMMPVCDEKSGRVFYSPCHAGCQSVNYDANGTVFSDCSCVADDSTLSKGFCQGHGDCFTGLVTLLIFTATSQFLGSTVIIGRMIIFYRSMIPEGRSLVISIGVLLVSIFALIPGPIIFGAIIDSACHIWETTCAGTLGHCWHYNNKILRYGFNLTAAGFLLCGGIFDILLWRKVKVKDVRLYDGDIDHIPTPSSSSGRPFDDMPRARISSTAYS